MTINGRPGSKWHLGFPVACRSSFGIYGAGWPALNRAFMACLWQGVNSVSGAQSLYLVLYSIFPSIKNIPNHMSPDSGLDSAEMICFFLFVGCNALLLMLDMPKWRFLVWAKLFLFAASTAGMLGWALVAGGGTKSLVLQGSTLTGSAKAWGIVRMILTSAAGCSTFASNAADFQRNATHPKDPIFGQLFGFPVSNLITQVFGMLVASTSSAVYGELIWNPVTYLKMLLEDNYDAPHRAAAFFIGVGFVYSLMFSCLFENLLPAGNDIASLVPKFINLKRGFLICLAVSVAINPWYLLGSASIFITVMSSYQIFLFSIVGVMLVDYYVVTKGWFDIDALFSPSPQGKYYYTFGCNPRAFAAYLVGVAVNFAGFLTNFGIIESTRLTRSYWFSILTTTTAAGGVYYLANRVWPQPSRMEVWSEPKGTWEYEPKADADVADDRSEEKSLEKEDGVSEVKPVNELYA